MFTVYITSCTLSCSFTLLSSYWWSSWSGLPLSEHSKQMWNLYSTSVCPLFFCSKMRILLKPFQKITFSTWYDLTLKTTKHQLFPVSMAMVQCHLHRWHQYLSTDFILESNIYIDSYMFLLLYKSTPKKYPGRQEFNPPPLSHVMSILSRSWVDMLQEEIVKVDSRMRLKRVDLCGWCV